MEMKELEKVVNLPQEFLEEVSNTSMDKTEAQQIAANYVPFMDDLQVQMERLNELKKDDPQNAEAFGRIRKDLGKLKSAVDARKDRDKEIIKVKGNLIQSLRNTVWNSAVLTQNEAKEYEEREERLRAAALKILSDDRRLKLTPYVEDVDSIDIDFGTMEEEIFDAFLQKKINDHHDLIEAQKKVEEVRVERIRVEALHVQRKNQLLEFWSFVSDDIKSGSFGELSDEEFSKILTDASKASDEEKARVQKLEEQAKVLKAEADAKEKARVTLQNKVRSRVSRFEDVSWDGQTMKDRETSDVLVEIAFLETSSEEEFGKKLSAWEKVVSDRAERKRLADEIRKKELAELAEKQRLVSLAEAEAKKVAKEKELAAKAPDKEKLQTLSKDILKFSLPEVSTPEAKALIENVKGLLLKVANYIDDNVKTM